MFSFNESRHDGVSTEDKERATRSILQIIMACHHVTMIVVRGGLMGIFLGVTRKLCLFHVPKCNGHVTLHVIYCPSLLSPLPPPPLPSAAVVTLLARRR